MVSIGFGLVLFRDGLVWFGWFRFGLGWLRVWLAVIWLGFGLGLVVLLFGLGLFWAGLVWLQSFQLFWGE